MPLQLKWLLSVFHFGDEVFQAYSSSLFLWTLKAEKEALYLLHPAFSDLDASKGVSIIPGSSQLPSWQEKMA